MPRRDISLEKQGLSEVRKEEGSVRPETGLGGAGIGLQAGHGEGMSEAIGEGQLGGDVGRVVGDPDPDPDVNQGASG